MTNSLTPPRTEKDVALRVAPTAASGSGVATPLKLSNLDLNGRLVKRGLVVSWHGWRANVIRVRAGRCVVEFHTRPTASPYKTKLLACESVQVVKA